MPSIILRMYRSFLYVFIYCSTCLNNILLLPVCSQIGISEKLLSAIDSLYRRKLLAKFVVDEAHCVSQASTLYSFYMSLYSTIYFPFSFLCIPIPSVFIISIYLLLFSLSRHLSDCLLPWASPTLPFSLLLMSVPLYFAFFFLALTHFSVS